MSCSPKKILTYSFPSSLNTDRNPIPRPQYLYKTDTHLVTPSTLYGYVAAKLSCAYVTNPISKRLIMNLKQKRKIS